MTNLNSNITGMTLGRYQVQQSIGKGGMAEVYKAYDKQLDRFVAMKIIHCPFGDPVIYLKRFEREAKALARLSHPHIVKLYEYGGFDGTPFLVMEYLAGGTLKDRITECQSYQKAAALLHPIARALDYAHNQHIIHRDVKPANILFTESGEPLLSDFGIIKHIGSAEQTSLTGSGIVIGSSDYMPPEQWTGSASPQTDIYALGVIFYQLITGKLPYKSGSAPERVIRQILDTLPNAKEVIADLPLQVEELIEKTLAKNPQDRYKSAGELAQALEEIASGERSTGARKTSQAKPPAPKPEPEKPSLRQPAVPPAQPDAPKKISLIPGASFGRYRILEPIGKKESASKFRVQDTLLDRVAALRIDQNNQELSPARLRQFEEEASQLSSLTHPNIARLVDYGVEKGVPFLVTQYVTAVSLQGQIGKPIPWQEVAAFLAPIANALATAHQKNILHRGLSPANILISDNGTPCLTDFNLPSLAKTEPGTGNGFHPYSAPEQAAGENYDQRADIYAFGAIFYEMLSGDLPYAAPSAPALVYKQMTQPLPDIRKIQPDLPDSLCEILQKALAKNPEDRYQEMNDLIIELKILLEQAAKQARFAAAAREQSARLKTDDSSSESKKRGRLRRFIRLFFYAIFLLAISVIIAYFYTRGAIPWLEMR